MKFLLDENVTSSIGKFLAESRYEVITLQKLRKFGVINGEVAQIAINERAIIVTFDSDFLHLKQQLQAKLGIIFIKMDGINPKLARF